MAANRLRRSTTLVAARSSTGVSATFARPRRDTTSFQVSGQTSAGAGSATVKLQGTNDKGPAPAWNDVATLVLTLGTVTTSVEASLRQAMPFRFYRTNTTAISGTGAQVDANMGVR